ncbi:jg8316 [Pararge aegeria aegeria]|uniref:Jg8316 protein n=1 Tax=Pararge aegeria aegeria TaxID=348720 RepID=A0A8S4SNT2_9NEOP|nr:jg8316 [Pararge aegeria aegeria]
MDHDEDRSLSLGTEVSASVPPPSPLTGCYLLAVIGEPHTHEHKEIILQRLVKGTYPYVQVEHLTHSKTQTPHSVSNRRIVRKTFVTSAVMVIIILVNGKTIVFRGNSKNDSVPV